MASPESLVEPKAISIGSLLGSHLFEIPDYQREFEWRNAELVSLWEDITQVALLSAAGKDLKDGLHFLGPVVVSEAPASATRSTRRLQVIDGQQRLTVITVFLTCLLDEAKALDVRSSGSGWNGQLERWLFELEAGRKILRLEPAPGRVREELERVVLALGSRTERENYIASLPTTERVARGRLARAFRFGYEKVDEYRSVHSADLDSAMESLFMAISSGLIVISAQVNDTRKAFDVFERLNSRGVPLGQADLIKNLFLNHAERDLKRTVIQEEWKKFVQIVEATARDLSTGEGAWLSVADFLQIIYASTWGSIRGSDLLNPYRDLLRGSANGSAQPVGVVELMKYLVKQAALLKEVVTPPAAWPASAHRMATVIRGFLRNKFSLTLLLSLRSRYSGTSPEFLWGLTLVNSYTFRSFVLGRQQLQAYSDNISSYARQIRWASASLPPGPQPSLGHGPGIQDLHDLAATMASELSDTELISDLAKFKPGTQKMGFYVAYMMEVGAARSQKKTAFSGQHPALQDSKTHLEHILPKNAAKASGWSALKLTREEAKDLAGMWGNLLVLPASVNQSIKDSSFADKCKAYKSKQCAALFLPAKVLAKHGVWNGEAIFKREFDLAKRYASLAWPFPLTVGEAVKL